MNINIDDQIKSCYSLTYYRLSGENITFCVMNYDAIIKPKELYQTVNICIQCGIPFVINGIDGYFTFDGESFEKEFNMTAFFGLKPTVEKLKVMEMLLLT